MKCPYQINVDCKHVATSDKPCEECELYNHGIRYTGCYKQTTVLAIGIILILLYIIL